MSHIVFNKVNGTWFGCCGFIPNLHEGVLFGDVHDLRTNVIKSGTKLDNITIRLSMACKIFIPIGKSGNNFTCLDIESTKNCLKNQVQNIKIHSYVKDILIERPFPYLIL